MSKEKKPKKVYRHPHLRRLGIALCVIVILVAIMAGLMLSTYIPRSYKVDWSSPLVSGNPHILNDGVTNEDGTYRTLVCAHRAGRTLAPENTIAAFAKCFDNQEQFGYAFDTLEFDLHLTRDGYLVLLHDDTLDRTSNCVALGEKNVYPKDKDLAELKTYNMAYNFEDPDHPGTFPYREASDAELDAANCRICKVEEVFDYVKMRAPDKKMRYIIEIKNDGKLGEEATDKLYNILVEYDLLDDVVVGTFNQNVTTYIDNNYRHREDGKNIIRSASITEVLSFYFCMMFNVDLHNKDLGFSVLQIPYKDFVINLGKPAFIEYAHAHGIAVQYWTINDAKSMQELAAAGADTIITDNPKLLYDTIKKVSQ